MNRAKPMLRAFSTASRWADDILDVHPPIKQLVRLDIGNFVARADRVVVIGLGKEPRGPQHDDWQAVLAEEELTEALRRYFGHAIDVPRYWRDFLGHPDRRRACSRRQRSAERAGRTGEDESFDPGGDGFLYCFRADTGELFWKYEAGEDLVTVPVVAELLAVNVTVLVPVAGFGLNAAVVPLRMPDAESDTAPVKPPVG